MYNNETVDKSLNIYFSVPVNKVNGLLSKKLYLVILPSVNTFCVNVNHTQTSNKKHIHKNNIHKSMFIANGNIQTILVF